MENGKKKRSLSLIQPTSVATLGNYLGAMKGWPEFQKEYDTVYGVADLHSLTVRQDPEKLKNQINELYAMLIAIGLDPERGIIFIQSQVPAHAQLAWILNCYTQFGELSRMTQFKEKSQKHSDNINAGLFTYPCLMAADILLYDSDIVPVGEDQKQHIEICRDIAIRFNNIYGYVFNVPEAYLQQKGRRIMSLTNPAVKMSKSDPNPKGTVFITDSPETIMKKFKSAVTDSEMSVHYAPGKDGIDNLITIYSAITDLTFDEIETKFAGRGYGDFKKAVGEAVVEELRPVREKYNSLLENQDYLTKCQKEGAEKARKVSEKVLDRVKESIGLII